MWTNTQRVCPSLFFAFVHSAVPRAVEGSGLAGKVELRLTVVVIACEIWRLWGEGVEGREPWGEINLESFGGRSRTELGLGGWAGFRSEEGRGDPWKDYEPLMQAALSQERCQEEGGRSSQR